MKNLFFVLSFLCIGQSTLAQTKADILEALQSTSHALDADADYSYLVNSSGISYNIPSNWDISVEQVYNKTIKIYNADGLDMANVVIPLWVSKNDRERMQQMKVRLHKLVNGSMTTEKVKIEKYTEKNEDVILYKFSVPDVGVGDVIEMRYMISSPYVTILPRFYFQHEVPIDSAHYSIDVPGYFGMTPNLKGYLDIKVTDRSLMSDHYEKRYMLNATDIKPIKNPNYVMNTNDYRSSIKYEIESYQIPGREKVKLSSTWNDVGDNIWDNWQFKKALKFNKFEGLPDFSIIQDTIEKTKAALNYIHENFTWNKKRFSNDPSMKKLVAIKTGNLLDINLAFINILQKQGIEAAPLISRMRRHGYINDKFPSRGSFNNVLTYIKVSNGYIIIDPSDKNFDFGQVSIPHRNFSGLILHNEKDAEFFYYDTKNVFKKRTQASININNASTLDIFKKEKLRSSAKTAYISNKDNYIPEESTLEKTPIIKRDEAIMLEYSYALENAVVSIENKLILPICIDCPLTLIDTKEKDRNYPLILSAKQQQTYIYQLNIPEGYIIESIPEDKKIKNYNSMAEMNYSAKNNGDKLIVTIQYEIKKEVFTPKEYKTLKISIDKMKTLLEESIVLIKD